MKRVFGLCLMVGLSTVLLCSFALAEAVGPKKIFIVSSYAQDNICGLPQYQGVIEAIAGAGFRIDTDVKIYSYAMETKKVNNTPALIDAQAEIVLAKIEKINPDVVVVLDDNAFRAVALKLVDSKIAVVFSGLNGQPEDYNEIVTWIDSRSKPGHNITGIYEKLHIVQAFKVQKKILPDLERALIVSDESPTGKAVLKEVNLELSEESVDVFFDVKIATSWEDYKDIILKSCSSPDIGTIYTAATLLKDKHGQVHSTSEIIKWTVGNCLKPGIPINYSFSRLGMFGGAGVDFISMGRQAGVMVGRILNGDKPGDIAIENAKRYGLVFNLKRAEELGITIPNDVLMASDAIYR
ncbi:ABC transporter substrate-binding protein [Maridesulfovibrio frigidus]|uniref:ABC transporter substrate-binding protein n=1 Tax=Maridesulfovibrio frigidus TaxID=340956 RepID=UPI0004E204A7|nr:ABC transporter substrate binding protein [Maridesulfovibrio frigidus]